MPTKLTKKQQQEISAEALRLAIEAVSRPEVVAALETIANAPVSKPVAEAARVLVRTIESSKPKP